LKIVLFGSYAKGTNKEESDIDVAVIVEKIDGSFLEKEAGLYKIRRNIDENIEPVLFEAGSDKSGFLESILSYGEVIYQR
jgi:predicted nucleotidyltransferase